MSAGVVVRLKRDFIKEFVSCIGNPKIDLAFHETNTPVFCMVFALVRIASSENHCRRGDCDLFLEVFPKIDQCHWFL